VRLTVGVRKDGSGFKNGSVRSRYGSWSENTRALLVKVWSQNNPFLLEL
jgi:hypothetical protein